MKKRKNFSVCLVLLILLAGYLMFWPVPIESRGWKAPLAQGYEGVYTPNKALLGLELEALGGQHGPEAVVVNSAGDVFVATHEGWLMRKALSDHSFKPWVMTGGRPLGMAFDADENLLVADAYIGLIAVDKRGEQKLLVDAYQGERLSYVNDLDVAPDGTVYFSDSSNKYSAKAEGGTLAASLLDILEHGGRGRLFSYDPVTGDLQQRMKGLNFANGVAVSADGAFVLVAETGSYRVHKLFLKGEKQGQSEVLLDNLPGFPDNLSRGLDGRFWLGLTSPRNSLIDRLSDSPRLRDMIQRLPKVIRPNAVSYGHVLAFNERGEVLVSLQDPNGTYPLTTGAAETRDTLYISSLIAKNLGRLAVNEIEF